MATTQAALADFESTSSRFGTGHLPYEVPHPSGDQSMARDDHREFYWTLFDRETYECPDCGRGDDEVNDFEVHHLDRDPLNGRLWNLLAVCNRCHVWRHGGDNLSGWSVEEWKRGFVDDEYHPVGKASR